MKATISLVLTLAFAIVVSVKSQGSEDLQKLYMGFLKDCAAANKITDEEAMMIDAGQAKEEKDEYKCYTKCFGDKIKFFSDDKYNVQPLIDIAKAFGKDTTKLESIEDKCKDSFKKPFDCQASWDAFKCISMA